MSLIPIQLKKWTQARIGLRQVGISLSTAEILQFKLAHALARDAVHATWDYEKTATDLSQRGTETLTVFSEITHRDEYLQRPDLGRTLCEKSRTFLKEKGFSQIDLQYDLTFIVSDGLSATALQNHFLPFWDALQKLIPSHSKISIGPLILAPFSRVAIGDEIGNLLKTRITVLIIGERPGLSAPDSMGLYITYDPKIGTPDARRNCISNIRPPHGLSYDLAAHFLFQIIHSSLIQRVTGVQLRLDTAHSIPSKF